MSIDSVTSLTPTIQADSLLISTLDSTLRLFDRQNGKLLQSYTSPQYKNTEYRIRSALGMSDSVVLSGSEEGTIIAWDLVDGKVIGEFRHTASIGNGKKDVISAVAVCKRRREWCSAGGDGNVIVWGDGILK
jgi:mitogen-activated protein kinase organizer 1